MSNFFSDRFTAVRERWFNRRLFGMQLKQSTATAVGETNLDYNELMQIYTNTHPDYVLGASFARVIIDVTASFIGNPTFRSIDDKANAFLESFVLRNQSLFTRITREHRMLGDVYVWPKVVETPSPLYPEMRNKIDLEILKPERVRKVMDPANPREVDRYVITTPSQWEDEAGTVYQFTVKQVVTASLITTTVEGQVPPGMEAQKEEANIYGFIPIVHFKANGENSLLGQSDLVRLLPYMKVYHDTFYAALQGSKMHSTPRLLAKVKDVSQFITNNFGLATLKQAEQTGTLEMTLTGREMMVMGVEESLQFVETGNATGAAKDLLKMIFYNIVDISTVPEFAYGVHTPSALASVQEQMPIFIRSVQQKRDASASAWEELMRMVLALDKKRNNSAYSTFEIETVWEKIEYRKGEDISSEMKNVSDSLTNAVNEGLMSREAASEHLRKYIDTMLPYKGVDNEEGERDKINDEMINQMRSPDTTLMQSEATDLLKSLEEQRKQRMSGEDVG